MPRNPTPGRADGLPRARTARPEGDSIPDASGRAAAVHPRAAAAPSTSPAAPSQLPSRDAAGDPSPAGRAAEPVLPAGSRGLRGAEWQAAVKLAQRRQPGRGTPRAAARVTVPPVTGGAVLTATANCLGRCDWTAGPSDPAEVDKAAERHTTKPPKHPTNTVSVVAEIGGAA